MKSQKAVSLSVAAVAVTAIAAGSLLFNGGGDNSASALGLSDGQVQQIAVNVAQTPEADREAYLQKIADNLGVDLAKLKEAIGKANVDTLDEKVADGTIPKERADEMREKLQSGDTFFFGGRGPGGPGGPGEHGFGMGGGPGAIMSPGLADFLGIDQATLMTELQTKSLATIATEHGKTVEELKAFLTTEIRDQLADRVASGDISQDDADEKIAELEQHLDEEINEVHAMGMHGDGPRGPRPMGMGGTAPGTTPSTQSSAPVQ